MSAKRSSVAGGREGPGVGSASASASAGGAVSTGWAVVFWSGAVGSLPYTATGLTKELCNCKIFNWRLTGCIHCRFSRRWKSCFVRLIFVVISSHPPNSAVAATCAFLPHRPGLP